MKRTHVALLVAMAAFAISVARPDDNEAVKKDLALLQGEWTMVSGSADGQPMPADTRTQMKRICKGDEVTITIRGNTYFKAKFTLDTSKQPKTIDYAMTEGITKGKQQLGIYEINGETLKFCFAKPGADRPAEFSSKSGDGYTLSVWKKEKPAAQGAGR